MKTQKGSAGKAFKLSVTTLAIMNITAVVSLRGLPAEAIYGLSSAFYYLFAAVVFLIPTAMVPALPVRNTDFPVNFTYLSAISKISSFSISLLFQANIAISEDKSTISPNGKAQNQYPDHAMTVYA